MSKGKKTKLLQYNLHDRGRQHTGIDRSNVDFKKMIQLINSPQTQEMVKTGQLVGYYGHQIRQRYGMVPPESVPIDGKMVQLAPAFRTIEIKATSDGTVTHRAEFLDNRVGKFAQEQYLAKIGGFSTAVNYRKTPPNLLTPSSFFGFDYVVQPNYATNIGDGQLFDGLAIPEELENEISCFDSATDITLLDPSKAMIAHLLEQQIISTYDSINTQVALEQINEQALDQIDALSQQMAMQQRKRDLQVERQRELYSGMVGETRSFDSVIAEADQFLSAWEKQGKPQPKKQGNGLMKGMRRLISFGG